MINKITKIIFSLVFLVIIGFTAWALASPIMADDNANRKIVEGYAKVLRACYASIIVISVLAVGFMFADMGILREICFSLIIILYIVVYVLLGKISNDTGDSDYSYASLAMIIMQCITIFFLLMQFPVIFWIFLVVISIASNTPIGNIDFTSNYNIFQVSKNKKMK